MEAVRILMVLGGPVLWAVVAYSLYDLYRRAA